MDNNNNYNGQNKLGIYQNVVEECENDCFIIKKINEDISNQYNNQMNKNQICYLIELEDFENFKQNIEFKTFIEKISEYRNDLVYKFSLLESEGKQIKLDKLNNIIVNSIEELYELIKKNKSREYILINSDLSKDIIQNIDKGKYSCCYSFMSKELIIELNKDTLHFQLNNNVISEDNLKEKVYNQNKINKKDNIDINNENLNNNIKKDNLEKNNDLMNLINWFEKFYISNKEFNNSLNEEVKDNKKNYGYLINTKAFKEWKTFLNYDFMNSIFDEYLTGEKTNLEKEEKEEIMLKLKEKKIIKNTIPFLKFQSMKDIKTFNRINDFILINCEIFNLINEKEEKNYQIEYIIASEKQIELIKNDEKCLFFKSKNKIYSYINHNLYLLIKLIFYGKAIFKNKKSLNFYIPKKGLLTEYKKIFNYDSFQKIIIGSNLNNEINENEKEIFNFIENIQPDFISPIKTKIIKFEFNKIEKASHPFEIIVEKNISFDYLIEFDKILFDGYLIVNFCRLNSIPKESFIRIKIFFIKEKIIIIFINEQKRIFGQFGEIKESENKYIFEIDYLIPNI